LLPKAVAARLLGGDERKDIMKTMRAGTIAVVVLFLATASQAVAQSPATDSGTALGGGPGTTDTEGQPSCRRGDRGRLIRYRRVASHPTPASTRAYFDEWIAFYQDLYRFPPDIPVRFKYGFDSYKVTYCTVDAVLPGQSTARPTIVTGMVSVPRASGRLSTVAYVRGTAASYYDAPSNPNTFGELEPRGESFEGPPASAVFAGAGFIHIAPDYLGFGDSSVPRHRYFHAATETSSAVDLLAASRPVLARLHVKQNKDLFIFGFSQGGHTALALQRELENAHVDVTGNATVGGVFDVEQWFLASLANETTVTVPLYISYLLLAYDDIYDVYGQASDVFQEPYASTVSELFDMQHFWDDILAGLPATSRALLTPSFYAEVIANRQHPMRVRLRQNAVDRSRLDAPVRVYHSPLDEEVPYADALVSIDRLRRRGTDVTLRTLPPLDHVNSWIQAMPRAVTWFRTLD